MKCTENVETPADDAEEQKKKKPDNKPEVFLWSQSCDESNKLMVYS